MFSVSDMFQKLKSFRCGLERCNRSVPRKFFFAKVDVQSAFDSIPQDTIIRVMESIFEQERYLVSKHVEVKTGASSQVKRAQYKRNAGKTTKRWYSLANSPNDTSNLLNRISTNLAAHRKNVIFMGTSVKKVYQTSSLLDLLKSHVQDNLVKIGKKFYRQKGGIPQGSVLSTALCNYFYADLEREHLSFLDNRESLLMRLTDDFLLITTDRSKAARFVNTMHAGIPEYGVVVNPVKSLVNFELDMDSVQVSRLSAGHQFPYCGVKIDCSSLEILKEEQPAFDICMSHWPLPHVLFSLTVRMLLISLPHSQCSHGRFWSSSWPELPAKASQ
jgi:telomerase reverse transcriptase